MGGGFLKWLCPFLQTCHLLRFLWFLSHILILVIIITVGPHPVLLEAPQVTSLTHEEWDIHIISLVRKSPSWGQSQGLLSVGVFPSPPRCPTTVPFAALDPSPLPRCPERPQTCLQGPVRWMDALCDSVRVGRPGSGFPCGREAGK